MLVALMLHSAGNSTPRCSKLIEPSRQLVMTTSRRSQATSSYGCTPGVLRMRSIRSAFAALLPLARELRAGLLAVSVMPPPSTGKNALKCPVVPVARCCVWRCGQLALSPATGLPSPPPGRVRAGGRVPARRSVGGVSGLGDLGGPTAPAVVFLAPRDCVLAVVVVRGGGSRPLPEFRDGRLEVVE